MRRSVFHLQARGAGALFVTTTVLAGLSGCSIRNIGPQLKPGSSVPAAFPSAEQQNTLREYRIGPADKLDIKVFREPDLTSAGVPVDVDGHIRLPLVGEVTASGKTTSQLSRELERLYGPKYLVDPQITVTVVTSVTQKITIQGEIRSPGVYPIIGPTTLLDAISLGGGETEIASLRKVVILRMVNGQRMGAIFDVAAIRRGDAPSPTVYGNDVVIIGLSSARKLYRDILQSAPLFLGVFRPF